MRYLGLDISQKSTGWAVLDDGSLVDYGTLDFDRNNLLSDNLRLFETYIHSIMCKHGKFDGVCIEDTFFQKNPKTLKLLTRFGTAAILAVKRTDPLIPIYLLVVATIRSVHFPGRKVDKQQIYDYICSEYGLSGVVDDVTDAIAVGSVPFLKEDISKWQT